MKQSYYKKDLIKFYQHHIPSRSSVLIIGNSKTFLFNTIKIHDKPTKKQTYQFIIFVDSVNSLEDIQNTFHAVRNNCTKDTRIILNYFNSLWLPILKIAEFFHLKDSQPKANWLNTNDIKNLLELEHFQIIKEGRRLLFPFYIPLLSHFINTYIAPLPLCNHLCLTQYIIARPIHITSQKNLTVSIIIPARNEHGNIENIIKTVPKLGKHTELLFVEGHSVDNTWNEIKRVHRKYKNKDIICLRQRGIGKADAVWKGFHRATGDILMILDADLSVRPNELKKFYNAILHENGEFIFGSRLVYPIENGSMQTLNIFGNKIFSLLFSWILNQPIKDTLCGTKVLSKNNYIKILKNRNYFGDFDPFGDFDLIFGAAKLNLKFSEIPVKYMTRTYGKTNISRFRHGLLLLRMTIFSLNKIKFI